MIDIDDVRNASSEDPLSLAAMSQMARNFLENTRPELRIHGSYMEDGWDGVLAIFRFDVAPKSGDGCSRAWVVVGDLPPAVLTGDYHSPADVLQDYVRLMRRWTDAVLAGNEPPCDVYVAVEPNEELANMLVSRLKFIEKRIISPLRRGKRPT